MIIDKKGKLFGRINIIDLCVIVFVILAALVTYFKFNVSPKSSSAESNVVFEYTLKISDVREFTAKQFEKGDNIYDDETGKFIGQITNVEMNDAEGFVLKTDGTYSKTIKPERYDVMLTLETSGTINDSGYFADGVKQISPHSTIIISNKKLKTTSSVAEVYKK